MADKHSKFEMFVHSIPYRTEVEDIVMRGRKVERTATLYTPAEVRRFLAQFKQHRTIQ